MQHLGSRWILLQKTAESMIPPDLTTKTWSESRIPKDLMTKSTAKSMIAKDPMIATNVVANAVVEHVQYQVMLINGFSSKHSTISVCHWPRCCSAELSSMHKITVNC